MNVAFYAPMKPPDHPTPSGDREIARLLFRAMQDGGAAPRLVSTLRTLDMAGDGALQADLIDRAGEEAEWLVECLAADLPTAWLTYHSYYKAPDLLGPVVSGALNIPYLIVEPSISPRRREGAWARFAALSEAAIDHADLLLWTTPRDCPALQAAGHAQKMEHLPAFLDIGNVVPARPAHSPLRLLTVAMARPGDKLESYRRIAAALAHLSLDWELTIIGGGAAEAELGLMFDSFSPRVALLGTLTDPAVLRRHYEQADVFVWPGVNEGVGMVWLEAQAAGLPVAAEDGPAARAAISGGTLAPPDQPAALARAIAHAGRDRAQLSALARAHVTERHSLAAGAARLTSLIAEAAA